MMHRIGCSAACGILQNQGLNSCLLHWQEDYLPVSFQGIREAFFLLKYTDIEYGRVVFKTFSFFKKTFSCILYLTFSSFFWCVFNNSIENIIDLIMAFI